MGGAVSREGREEARPLSPGGFDMTEDAMEKIDRLSFNGVNGTTGEYGMPSMNMAIPSPAKNRVHTSTARRC